MRSESSLHPDEYWNWACHSCWCVQVRLCVLLACCLAVTSLRAGDITPPLPGIVFAEPPPKRIMAHGSLSPDQVMGEQRKLAGPLQIIPGELVTFSYGWDTQIVSKADPSKVGSTAAIKGQVLRFIAGDPASKIEVKLLSTGQDLLIARPVTPGAPSRNLVSLAKLPSIVGLSRAIIANRLGAPPQFRVSSDATSGPWHYTASLVEDTQGEHGPNGIYKAGTRRTFVLWDFTIVFGVDDLVTMIQQGQVGFTQAGRANF